MARNILRVFLSVFILILVKSVAAMDSFPNGEYVFRSEGFDIINKSRNLCYPGSKKDEPMIPATGTECKFCLRFNVPPDDGQLLWHMGFWNNRHDKIANFVANLSVHDANHNVLISQVIGSTVCTKAGKEIGTCKAFPPPVREEANPRPTYLSKSIIDKAKYIRVACGVNQNNDWDTVFEIIDKSFCVGSMLGGNFSCAINEAIKRQ